MRLLESSIRLEDDLCGQQMKLREWVRRTVVGGLVSGAAELALERSGGRAGGCGGQGGASSSFAEEEGLEVTEQNRASLSSPRESTSPWREREEPAMQQQHHQQQQQQRQQEEEQQQGASQPLELDKGSFCECYRRASSVWSVAVVRRSISSRGEPPEPHVEVAYLQVGSSSISGGLENTDTDVVPLSFTRPVSSKEALDWIANMTEEPIRAPQVYSTTPTTTSAPRRSRGGRGRGMAGKRGNHYNKKGGWGGGKRGRKPPKVWEQSPLHGVQSKYWAQRYRYWSRFDQGVRMTVDDWHSVTPEVISQHIAKRCGGPSRIVLDPFCGCGGNAVQFARLSRLVVCIDIDRERIEAARHNARIYGVENRIEFIVGDATKLIASMTAVDAVFLSPPWGGPGYIAEEEVHLRTMTPAPLDGVEIFKEARKASANVAYFVPRNCRGEEMAALADRGDICEVESQFLNGKLKTKTAYYGRLVSAGEGDGDEGTQPEHSDHNGGLLVAGEDSKGGMRPPQSSAVAAAPTRSAQPGAEEEDALYDSWFS